MGMTHEGSSPEHIMKWGVFEDVELYGILRSGWQRAEEKRIQVSGLRIQVPDS